MKYTYKGYAVEVLSEPDKWGWVNISEKGIAYSVKFAKLKTKKEPRVSRGVKRSQLEAAGTLPNYDYSEQYKGLTYPTEDAMDKWTPYFLAHSRLRITSSEPQKTAEESSAFLGISPRETEKYIEPCTEATHGAKFDIVVTDCLELANAPNDLRLFFNSEGHSCQSALEVQIGCREFAEHLMKNGLFPTQRRTQ
jgi:hypothetical protein